MGVVSTTKFKFKFYEYNLGTNSSMWDLPKDMLHLIWVYGQSILEVLKQNYTMFWKFKFGQM